MGVSSNTADFTDGTVGQRKVAEGKLTLELPGSRVQFAIPAGDRLFRVPGRTDTYLRFAAEGGQEAELIVEQDDTVIMTLVRFDVEP